MRLTRHEEVLIDLRDKLIVLPKTGFKIFNENKKIYCYFGCFVVNFWHS